MIAFLLDKNDYKLIIILTTNQSLPKCKKKQQQIYQIKRKILEKFTNFCTWSDLLSFWVKKENKKRNYSLDARTLNFEWMRNKKKNIYFLFIVA